MKLRSLIILGIAGGILTCSCTQRRRAGDVVADGDTVHVVIPDKHADTANPGSPAAPDSLDLHKQQQ